MNSYRYKKCCQLSEKKENEDCSMENMMAQSEGCSSIPQIPEYNCNCGFDENNDSVFPSKPMLAQSYVPIQKMKKVFNPEVGLKMGTIFPELVSPYYPCQSIREIEYLKNKNEIGEGCNE